MSYEYQLIVAVVDRGYAEEVMNLARGAGAGGGTIVHGRGTGTETAEKILGITICPEKDMVLIISKEDQKNDMMRAIARGAGLKEAGRGIVFSVPLDSVYGLSEPKPSEPKSSEEKES